MPHWRYEPKEDRTPKHHPIFGHLEWGQVYDNPACADNPDFTPVRDAKPAPAPVVPPVTDSADRPASEKPADAGKPGKE